MCPCSVSNKTPSENNMMTYGCINQWFSLYLNTSCMNIKPGCTSFQRAMVRLPQHGFGRPSPLSHDCPLAQPQQILRLSFACSYLPSQPILLGFIVGKVYERSTLPPPPIPTPRFALQENHFCVSGKVNSFYAALQRISFEKGDVHRCKKNRATDECPISSSEFLEWRFVNRSSESY